VEETPDDDGQVSPTPDVKPAAQAAEPEMEAPPTSVESQVQSAATDRSEPSPETETGAASGISLSELHRLWPKIKSMVGQHNRRTEGLLNTARIAGLQDNTLFLGFTSDTLKSMMDKETNLNLTCDILEETFGHPVLVKCIVSNSQTSAIPNNLKIDKDGMVGTATRDLGGKISKAEELD
jgi:DNA polymerase-3 subunit gamma/tau